MSLPEPTSRAEALELLRTLGAPRRLIRHGELVSEVAAEISEVLAGLGAAVDPVLVVIGAALHDVGKIGHPNELTGPGRRHEEGGEQLLLAQGLSPRTARICRTHGAWEGPEVTLEERVVALADNLWRDVRNECLEALVVEGVGTSLGVENWEAFVKLDSEFERIAADAPARLARARV